eukprot:2700027-Rhodomonas_salina.1
MLAYARVVAFHDKCCRGGRCAAHPRLVRRDGRLSKPVVSVESEPAVVTPVAGGARRRCVGSRCRPRCPRLAEAVAVVGAGV